MNAAKDTAGIDHLVSHCSPTQEFSKLGMEELILVELRADSVHGRVDHERLVSRPVSCYCCLLRSTYHLFGIHILKTYGNRSRDS